MFSPKPLDTLPLEVDAQKVQMRSDFSYTLLKYFVFLIQQYNDGLLPDIILLTHCYYHRGIRLNAMKRFCICSLL